MGETERIAAGDRIFLENGNSRGENGNSQGENGNSDFQIIRRTGGIKGIGDYVGSLRSR